MRHPIQSNAAATASDAVKKLVTKPEHVQATRSRNTPDSAIFVSRLSPTRLKAQHALGYYRAFCYTPRLSTRYGIFSTGTTFVRVRSESPDDLESCSLEYLLLWPTAQVSLIE